MSSCLYWKPTTPMKDSLPDRLKFVLRKHFDCTRLDEVLDTDFIPFLRGMESAGIEGARELIDIIYEHNEIHIKEEY